MMLASPAVWARLEIYADVLTAWNARINLIGRTTEASLKCRHLLDSLAVLPLLPAGVRRLVDLGTGAGLPGLPVAIVSGVETHLVDRDRRKCAFLREAARLTSAPVVIHEGDFSTLPGLSADAVLSRATGTLAALLDGGWRHARKGGVMVFHKTHSQAAEIAAARKRWRFALQAFASPADARGRLWRICGLERRRD